MIALVLGAGVVGAVVRSDDSDGDSTSAVGGPNETVVTVTVPTGATTTAAPTATTAPTGGPATTAPTGATGGTTATSTTVAATGSGSGGSGLGAEGAGDVAMGPTTPNTGAESLLAPSAGLVVSGAALRRMLRRR